MPYKRKIKATTTNIPALSGRLYTPEEASDYLGVAQQTLAHWRRRQNGPKYVLLSARCVRYAETALREWVEGRTQASTAENRRQD